MSRNPLVSVIIPAYNAQKYIKSAIESVLEQSYQPVECIVVDDGSTDDTAAIVKSYSDKVKYVYQDNAERSAARNKGLYHASGEYISFLDADDFFDKYKTEKQMEIFHNDQSIDLVFSKPIVFNESRNDYARLDLRLTNGQLSKRIFFGNFIYTSSYIVKKTAINKIDGFNTNYSHAEDWEFLLRLALTGSVFYFLDEYLSYYRVHGTNTISNQLVMYESCYNIAQKINENFHKKIIELEIMPEAFLSKHKANYGKQLILSGRIPEGRSLVKEACKYPLDNKILYTLLAATSTVMPVNVIKKFIKLRNYIVANYDVADQ
jgi:glycosyltransferase involved in cell wall biosynthesis